MAIQIIDGFRLNAATPIDSRMVTTGLTSRNNLAYKYEGLRVYDISEKKPYVYIDGAWKAESGSAAGGSSEGAAISGTTNRIVKYDNAFPSGATNSAIYDASTSLSSPRIGIGTSAPTAGIALDVIGHVRATSFRGNIGAENITSGQLALTRLSTGPLSGSYVLKSLNGNVSWVAESATAGTIAVTNETTYTSQAYLVFAKTWGSGGAQLFANDATATKRIAIKPDTSQILASSATENITKPGYSFVGVDTAGLYGVSTEIGLAFNGKKQLSIKDGNHTLYNSSSSAVLTTVSTGVSIGSNNTTTFDLFLKAGTGALATPNISWAGDTSTGIWRSAAGKISVSAIGVKVLEIGSQLLVPVGSAAAPGLSFLGTTNAGIYQASSKINFSVAGALVLSTGTNAFQVKMTSAAAGKALVATDSDGNATWDFVTPYGTIIMWFTATIPAGWKLCNGSGLIYLNGTYQAVPNLTDRMIVGGSGALFLAGSTSPTSALQTYLSMGQIPAHPHSLGQGGGATFKGTAESHSHTLGKRDGCGDNTSSRNFTSPGTESGNYQSGGTSLTPKGTVTISGYTQWTSNGGNEANSAYWNDTGGIRSTKNVNDGTKQPVTMPLYKTATLAFIIKVQTTTANTDGHWKAS